MPHDRLGASSNEQIGCLTPRQPLVLQPRLCEARAHGPQGRGYNRSDSETFTTGTMGDGVGVRDFEAAFLQIFAVIEDRTADEKRALGIDNQSDIGRRNHNVALLGSVHQVHGVLETGTTAADHSQAQRAVRITFLFKKRRQLSRRILGDLDQALVADLVIDWERRLFALHGSNLMAVPARSRSRVSHP